MIAASSLARLLSIWLQQKYTWDVTHELGVRLLRVYLSRPYTFFLKTNSAQLISNLIAETTRVTTGAILPLMRLVSNCVIVIWIIIALAVVNFKIAILSFLILGATFLIIYLLLKTRLDLLGKRRVELNASRYMSLKEVLDGIKTFKVFDVLPFFYDRYYSSSKEVSKIQPKVSFFSAAPRSLLDVVALGGVVVVLLYLTIRRQDFNELIPLLTLYALAFYKLLPAINNIYSSTTFLRHASSSIDLLAKDLNDVGDEDFMESKNTIVPFEKKITFQNVSYSFDEESKSVLNEISFEIEKGQKVAFIGTSGSGKTTVVDVLAGLLKPNGGEIIIDDLVLSPNHKVAWRQNIAYVPQEVFLFDDSIASNIILNDGEEKLDDVQLAEVVNVAQLEEFVQSQLDDGLNTRVGDHGVRLSGGQRQRIGLARALYQKPSVLILDEATSALDGPIEKSFFTALEKFDPNLTVIIIAHRLNSVEQADRIFVMENGTLRISGKYHELVAMDDSFNSYVNP